MKIKWTEHKTMCNKVYHVGTTPSILGNMIRAEIVEEIEGISYKAKMYHSVLASDELNIEKIFDNLIYAKEWCQKQIDSW